MISVDEAIRAKNNRMLSTLIYSSRLSRHHTPNLPRLEQVARDRNERNNITGILLFDGRNFFQILEGPEDTINLVFEQIKRDRRHENIVKIMNDYSPSRKFGEFGMRVLDIRAEDILSEASVSLRQALGTRLPPSDRVLKLIRAFAEGRWTTPDTAVLDVKLPGHEQQSSRRSPFPQLNGHCQFALQPIVDALDRQPSSYEALIRSPSGGSPAECFFGKKGDELYEFDLFSKKFAFELASNLNLQEKLSINLLPMSLVRVPDAAARLERYLKEANLRPDQVIIEITEDEAITYYDEFAAVLKHLRSCGFDLAIDDFGAGFAGLSLLTKFQPEKLKIDRSIVTGIEQDGPRQAIVRAIVECCRSLGITTVAEGVETDAEWRWLQASGIDLFQGFLFARPRIGALPEVNWPEFVQD